MPSPTIQRARELRKSMSETERKLWSRLRRKQLGFRFRRQVPIGPYFADFACPARMLIVEVDGEWHRQEYDEHRDRWLELRGWKVVRFGVQDLDESVDDVEEAIRFHMENWRPPPAAA